MHSLKKFNLNLHHITFTIARDTAAMEGNGAGMFTGTKLPSVNGVRAAWQRNARTDNNQNRSSISS